MTVLVVNGRLGLILTPYLPSPGFLNLITGPGVRSMRTGYPGNAASL